VELIFADGPRYSPEYLRTKIIAVEESVTPANKGSVPEFDLSRDAEPPADKLRALLQNPKVRASWDHDRDDLQDRSASAYDLSLASFAAARGWSDQEIVDLLIASRRHNHKPVKLRADYYERTLTTARRQQLGLANESGHLDDDDEGNPWREAIDNRGLIPVLADFFEDDNFFARDGRGLLYRYDTGTQPWHRHPAQHQNPRHGRLVAWI
jgi:hypothetical protein